MSTRVKHARTNVVEHSCESVVGSVRGPAIMNTRRRLKLTGSTSGDGKHRFASPTGSAHGTSYSFRGFSSCRLEPIKGSPGDVTEAESGLLVAQWHGPLLPTRPIEVPCPRGGLEL